MSEQSNKKEVKRRSNWKWWLGIGAPALVFCSHMARYANTQYRGYIGVETFGSVMCTGVIWFIIGLVIDLVRENRWHKQREKQNAKKYLQTGNNIHLEKVEGFCPKCGRPRLKEHVFCSNCGHKFIPEEKEIDFPPAI